MSKSTGFNWGRWRDAEHLLAQEYQLLGMALFAGRIKMDRGENGRAGNMILWAPEFWSWDGSFFPTGLFAFFGQYPAMNGWAIFKRSEYWGLVELRGTHLSKFLGWPPESFILLELLTDDLQC
jgi:hypothetical protein